MVRNSLSQLGPELGGGASGGAVSKVEDYACSMLATSFFTFGESVWISILSECGRRHHGRDERESGQRTLLNAVLLGLALALLLLDSLDAVVKVMLGAGALLGLLALCTVESVCQSLEKGIVLSVETIGNGIRVAKVCACPCGVSR